jgi:hypothetical protein
MFERRLLLNRIGTREFERRRPAVYLPRRLHWRILRKAGLIELDRLDNNVHFDHFDDIISFYTIKLCWIHEHDFSLYSTYWRTSHNDNNIHDAFFHVNHNDNVFDDDVAVVSAHFFLFNDIDIDHVTHSK